MSFFGKMFGGKKETAPTTGEAIQKLRDTEEMLNKKQEFLEKKVDAEMAIAKKNAVRLLSSENLMGMDHDRLIAIKSGGQSLRQLTDFCREIAAKGM